MEDKTKKLAKLIIDEDLNIDILSEILGRFIKLNPARNQIITLPDFLRLTYKDAIIIMILAFKALKELKSRESEMVGPTEISKNCGIKLSTTKNALRDLEKSRMATSIKGKYTIPNFLLYNLKEKFGDLVLEKSGKKTTERRKRQRAKSDFSRINKILSSKPEDISGDFYTFLTEKRGEYLRKSLILIKVAKDQFNIDGLTTAEMTKILNQIGIPMYQSNISTALGNRQSLKYVFKEPTERKKTYVYKLTKKGVDLVSGVMKK